jgi:hypothetical protein
MRMSGLEFETTITQSFWLATAAGLTEERLAELLGDGKT